MLRQHLVARVYRGYFNARNSSFEWHFLLFMHSKFVSFMFGFIDTSLAHKDLLLYRKMFSCSKTQTFHHSFPLVSLPPFSVVAVCANEGRTNGGNDAMREPGNLLSTELAVPRGFGYSGDASTQPFVYDR
jgi:hypothetical protein